MSRHSPNRPPFADRVPSPLWTSGPGQEALATMQQLSRAGSFRSARLRRFLDAISQDASKKRCSCPTCRSQRKS